MYYKSLDHMILAAVALKSGKPNTAAKWLAKAAAEKDCDDMLTAMDDMQADSADTDSSVQCDDPKTQRPAIARALEKAHLSRKRKAQLAARDEDEDDDTEDEDEDKDKDDAIEAGAEEDDEDDDDVDEDKVTARLARASRNRRTRR